MPFAKRSCYDWKLRTQSLPLGKRTLVMGILNTTPDSFSDGGAFATHARAIEHALAMLEDGADIVDIGGESTRPGKRQPLGIQEEIDRVLPVLEGVLRHRPESILSIDTYKSATAAAALHAGAQIVNDVSGFSWDEAMARVCAAAGCGVVLMHLRGRPEQWEEIPVTDAEPLVSLIKQDLQQRLEKPGRQESRGRELSSTPASASAKPSTGTTSCSRVWKSSAVWGSRYLRVFPARHFWAGPWLPSIRESTRRSNAGGPRPWQQSPPPY